MTAPQPATPGSDSVREELIEVLVGHFVLYGVDDRAHCILCGWVGSSENLQSSVHLADILVPLVDRLLAEAKAEALEEAALELSWPDPRGMWRASDVLRDRAAAYRTNPSSEETHRG